MLQARPHISVVLPAYNERQNIAPMAARLSHVLRPLGDWEIIFVDDCSTDGTLAEIKRIAAHEPRVRFVSFTRNFGHSAALRAGIPHTRGAAVVLMDCDFEHPPELIPKLVEAWRAGAKVVVTQRTTLPHQTTLVKRLTSNLFYRLFNMVSDVRIEPGSADFLLLDRSAVDTLAKFEGQQLFLRGFVRWLGLPTTNVTYTQGDRHAGSTKFTFASMLNFAAMGVIAHSIKPLRIGLYFSLAFALLSALLFVYSIVSYFAGRTAPGWTSEMATIAILGSGQFLVLGIIGEYLGQVLRQTRGWPLYVVAETEASEALSNPEAPPAAPRSASGGA
jgi:dolichol-phosphate mannosyltransferase